MKKTQQKSDISKASLIGIKNTPHRNKIIQLLENHPKPLSAEEIFLVLRSEGLPISLSTVYRILERLLQAGIVQKWHLFNEGRVSYAIQTKKHLHHFICLRCHRMIELPDCPIEAMERNLEKQDGIQVTGHQLELYGYCSHCR